MNDIMETDRGRTPQGVGGKKTTRKTLKYLEEEKFPLTKQKKITKTNRNTNTNTKKLLGESGGGKQLGKHRNI